MRNDKQQAIALRKKGKSYNEISEKLGVPKSTLSGWFSGAEWSHRIKKELIKKAQQRDKKRLRAMSRKQKRKWEEWRKEARKKGEKEFKKLKRDPLFIAGIMLYWGEGDSRIENSVVRLTNTDPDLIWIFILFLKKICKVPQEKIKIAPIIYPDLNEKTCRKYWSKISGIPLENFTKTQCIKGKHPTKRLRYGICNVVVSSRQLKEKIFVWIDLFSKDFS